MGSGKRYWNERKVTRSVSSFAAAGLLLASLVVASGCGSKSSSGVRSVSTSPTSSAAVTAFVARANAICTRGQAGPGPGPFPFPSFDPLHPDRSKLPAIGRYFKRANEPSILRRELAQLRALGTPPTDQPDWQRLLATKQSSLTATARQYQAALASDVPTFIATVNALTTAGTQERAAASGFGATGCAPPGANQPAAPPPGAPAPPSGPPPGARAIPRQARVALSQLAACMRANGVAVQANTSGNGPPLTTRVPATDPKYVAAGAKCRAKLASRFPLLARSPTPP
jgi:hypothetical protein